MSDSREDLYAVVRPFFLLQRRAIKFAIETVSEEKKQQSAIAAFRQLTNAAMASNIALLRVASNTHGPLCDVATQLLTACDEVINDSVRAFESGPPQAAVDAAESHDGPADDGSNDFGEQR